MKIHRSWRKGMVWFILAWLGVVAIGLHPAGATVPSQAPAALQQWSSTVPPDPAPSQQPIADSAPPFLTSGLEQVQQARSLYEAGRFAEAAVLLQQAADGFAAQGDRLNQAMALSNLAATQEQLQAWDQAQRALQTSLSLLNQQAPSPEQQRIWAQTLDIQGQLQLEQGQFQAAYDTWRKAAGRYEALGSQPARLQNQVNQSLALQSLGLYPRACKTLLAALGLEAEECKLSDAALPSLKQQPASLVRLRGLDALGHTLRVLGQLNESQAILDWALQVAQRLGLPQEQAVIELSRGNTARALANQPAFKPEQREQFEQAALVAYRQSAALARRPETQRQATLNQLSLFVAREQWDQAQALLKGQDLLASPFAANRAGITAQINLAQSLMDLAERSPNPSVPLWSIAPLLARAENQAHHLGNDRLQAHALAAQGRLAELQSNWSAAEAATLEALRLVPEFSYPDIAYQLRWQLGRIATAQGKQDLAIVQYTQSVEILSSLRGDLVTVNPEVQLSFRESVEPIYRQLVALLLTGEAPNQARLKQARQTIEALQLAEIDNFFRDTCAETQSTSLENVDPTAAVIYPILLRDRIEVIVSIPGQPLEHYSTRKSAEQVEDTFRRARRNFAPTARSAREALFVARQLYSWLISPVEKSLKSHNIKTLVFVLDGYLRNLPMAALHDGEKYLIEKYNLSVAPGLKLIQSKPLQGGNFQILAGGLTEERQGFSSLPAVGPEVVSISQTFSTKLLLNDQFTSAALKEQIRVLPFSVMHLATHGRFSSNAEETYILTWDGRVNVKELDQLLRSRLVGTQQQIELLVLSACQTAAGDDRASLGLAGVAIRSGARSTVGTLWSVNDESTSIFMADFYRELAKPQISKAQALRNAQVAMLKTRRYQNPYYWAPFVLVGNWQ